MAVLAPTTEQLRAAWDAIAFGFDRFVTPESMQLGERLLDYVDLRPGTRLLEVAAGSGAVALPAARRGADVVAIDVAATMVDRLAARARALDLSSLEVQLMDGARIDLPEDSFDVCVSLNAVPLFSDLGIAFREMGRVTRAEGRVLVAAVGEPRRVEFLGYFLGALQAIVDGFTPPAMDPPPLPFQVADPGELRQRLVITGLAHVRVETVTWEMRFSSGAHLWNLATSSNPISAALTAGLTHDQSNAVQHVLDGMLRERSGGEPGAVLGAEIHIGIGTVPPRHH